MKRIRLGVLMDDISNIKPNKDSSFAMMLEAQALAGKFIPLIALICIIRMARFLPQQELQKFKTQKQAGSAQSPQARSI